MAVITNTRDVYLQAAYRSQILGLTLSYEVSDLSIDIKAVNATGINLVEYDFDITNQTTNTTYFVTTGTPQYTFVAPEAGIYLIAVLGKDITGNETSLSTITVTIASPTTSFSSAIITGPNLKLDWSLATGDIAVDYYEIRYSAAGGTWAAATAVGTTKATTYTTRVNYTGNRLWWIAAKTIGGTYSTPISTSVTINAPSAVSTSSITAEIVDNNVLLKWAANTISTGQLPIDYYTVKRGDTYATSTVVGSNGNSTFTSVFEQAAGNYNYWIVPTDTAGTDGPAVSKTATVTQPPDYVLKSNYNSNFTLGYNTNLYFENGSLIGPVNTTQTWSAHFLAGSTAHTATITGLPSTTGILVGQKVVASAGTGSLYNTPATYAVVTSIVSSTSITCTTAGGTVPTPGTITNIYVNSVFISATATVGSIVAATAWNSPSDQVTAGYPIYIAPNIVYGEYLEYIDYGTSTVISTTGTVGTITGTGPWTSTITGMTSTTGLSVGNIITVTNGTGKLYDSATTYYAVVASIVSSTSITCTTTGGTTPVAGTITNITKSSVISPTSITATLSTATISGGVTVECYISYKTVAAEPYIAATVTSQTSVVLPVFRYVKVRFLLFPANTPGSNLIQLTGLNIKLATKIRTESGSGTYYTSRPDSGTNSNFVAFSYPFISADTPVVQPTTLTSGLGTATALTPLVIYDGGSNPTGFSVRLYDKNGLATDGTYSWTVRGS